MKHALQQRLYTTRVFPTLKQTMERTSPARRRAHRARVAFYSQFVSPGGLCFDVGANTGSRTGALLDVGARVIAVEPQPVCVRTLSHRFGRDPLFTLVPTAAGGELGSAEMRLSRWPVLSSLSSAYVEAYPARHWMGTCEVRVTTLDALIDVFGVPDYVKVDVEGFEAEVIRGLSQPLAALSLEMNPRLRDTAAEALGRVDDLGPYQVAFSEAETLRLSEWMSVRQAVERLDEWESYGDFHCVLQSAEHPEGRKADRSPR